MNPATEKEAIMITRNYRLTCELVGAFIAVFGTVSAVAWARNQTITGNLNVSGNVTAGSINLGGTTRTNWPTGFSPAVVLTNGTVDTSLSQYYAITLTDNATWDFEGHSAGRSFSLKVAQDSTGGWTNSWAGNILWPGGVRPQPSTSANHWDLFRFVDDGTYWLGTVDGMNYATNFGYALQFDG